ncbi:Kelch repeat-containing protein, partial [Deinococcus petrolearius]
NGISYDHADWADARVACPADTAPPTAPSGLGATGAADGITLGWAAGAEPDLAGYRVERAALAQGPFAPAHDGLLTAPGFSDPYAPENATSVYRVLAVDRAGNASAPATVSAARPRSAPTPALRYSALPDQPQGVSEAQGRALNGRLYTFGGFDSLKGCCTPTNRAYVYDPATGRWTPLAPLPDRGVTHAGLATDGENFYVVGGYAADAAWTGQVFGTRAGWRYSVRDDTYTRLPDLPVERSGGQLEYLNGQLHYFGGTNLARTQNVGDHFVLDLRSGATGWRVAAPLPLPRHHLGSAVLGGLIYAVGGQQGHDSQLVTQSAVQVYDPATDAWTSRAALPRARGHISGSTFVLGGRLIVAGGEVAHDRAVADVTAYDPATNTWTALTPLPAARASGVAAALGQGYLYTGGAWSRSGWRAQP